MPQPSAPSAIESASPGRFQPGEYKNAVAFVYMAALFVQVMDGTIINVALPTLAEEFGVRVTAVDWTVLSFAIALAVVTAAAGWLGDRFGLKPMFVTAIFGFTAASVLCGAAQTLGQLVAARAVQGTFAGAMAPIGSALLFRAFPLEERATAARKIVTVVVIAPAIGPLVGGALLEIASWRWIFFVNVPIGLAASAMAILWLKPDVGEPQESFDFAGFFLAVTGLGLLIFGISRGSERGWGATSIQASIVVGVLALVGLAVVELRSRHPLIELRLLADRLFGVMNLLALPLYGGFLSLVFVLPQYLQNEGGYSPLAAGFALLPQPVGVLVLSQITGRGLYRRFGPRRLIVAGCVLGAATGVATAMLEPDSAVWLVQIIMFLRGAAMGLCFVPMQSATYATIKNQDLSQAAAIYATARQVAPALGIAIASAVLTAGLGSADTPAERVGSYQAALYAGAAMFVIALVISFWIRDEDAAATMA